MLQCEEELLRCVHTDSGVMEREMRTERIITDSKVQQGEAGVKQGAEAELLELWAADLTHCWS